MEGRQEPPANQGVRGRYQEEKETIKNKKKGQTRQYTLARNKKGETQNSLRDGTGNLTQKRERKRRPRREIHEKPTATPWEKGKKHNKIKRKLRRGQSSP